VGGRGVAAFVLQKSLPPCLPCRFIIIKGSKQGRFKGTGSKPREKTEEVHLVKKQPVEGRQPLKKTEEGYLVKNNQEMKLDSGTP